MINAQNPMVKSSKVGRIPLQASHIIFEAQINSIKAPSELRMDLP